MKLQRVYSAEPISDETGRRLRMGRNKTRLIGILAASIGALSIPAGIAAIGMGYFKLEDKTIAVFPRMLSEEEAKAETQKVKEQAEAFRQKSNVGQVEQSEP